MRYGKNIVNQLLDSYEDCGNFDGNIGRKVYLKKSFKHPSGDSADYEEFLSELIELHEKEILDFDWQVKNHVADRIWLILDNVQSAYNFVSRAGACRNGCTEIRKRHWQRMDKAVFGQGA